MNLQQYQEDTLKKVDTIFALSIHPELRDEIKLVLSDSLKGQLEVVVAGLPKECEIYKTLQTEVSDLIGKGFNSALYDITTPLLEEIKRI